MRSTKNWLPDWLPVT